MNVEYIKGIQNIIAFSIAQKQIKTSFSLHPSKLQDNRGQSDVLRVTT